MSEVHPNKNGLVSSVFSSSNGRDAIEIAPIMETMIAIKTNRCMLKGDMVQPKKK
jgi:hypothetical protein